MGSGHGDISQYTASVCTICQNPLKSGEEAKRCDSCGAVFHKLCWQTNEGCGTYGCGLAPKGRKLAIFETEVSGVWGDTKACPNCGEILDAFVLKCKYCKAVFDTRMPMSIEEYTAQESRHRKIKLSTGLAITVFCVSAVGFFAPVTLVISSLLLLWMRRTLKRVVGAAEILFLGSIVLSVAYVTLLLAIFAGHW
jgi:predicted RNA-binding Zn-ribbon protein involved in translation (DUF1610 family)